MATQTATDAIYRALRTPEPDPDLAHAAVEEIRELSGQNVIAVVGSQIAELKSQMADFRAEMKAEITEVRAEVKAEITEVRAEMKAGFAEVNARIDAQAARIDAQSARIDTQSARIDVMQRVVWRVIWPLIVLLAAPVLGFLYQTLTAVSR
ncbi:MAG: DUF1640 domain-containing protein [Bryobacterales bacterium]|nr:DUF1640 domain-containing protein [Bryobacterales bacterium]MDE0292932.1 DUF1640 domain-containing protein [Bryobacterales bacterium]